MRTAVFGACILALCGTAAAVDHGDMGEGADQTAGGLLPEGQEVGAESDVGEVQESEVEVEKIEASQIEAGVLRLEGLDQDVGAMLQDLEERMNTIEQEHQTLKEEHNRLMEAQDVQEQPDAQEEEGFLEGILQ